MDKGKDFGKELIQQKLEKESNERNSNEEEHLDEKALCASCGGIGYKIIDEAKVRCDNCCRKDNSETLRNINSQKI
jgi:hypothetical protein